MIDSSDEVEYSSAEENVRSNPPVSDQEERGGWAAALRNGSGTSSISSTTRTVKTVEKGSGMIKL